MIRVTPVFFAKPKFSAFDGTFKTSDGVVIQEHS